MSDKIIQNFDGLAINSLRRDGLEILEAGYEAILTEQVVKNNIKLEGNILHIKENTVDLSGFDRVFFLAIGKCALDTAKAIEDIMADKITAGVALDVRSEPLKKIKSLAGTHPLPSEKNVLATQEILQMVSGLNEKDLVLVFVSGGGSSLFSAPSSLSVENMVKLTQYAIDKGVTIAELNIVRKHLSSVKGGQLSKIMFPATIYSLIFSDVPGDDMGSVASGPTVLDSSTRQDAEAIIAKYQAFDVLSWPGFELLETPKEEKYFEKVKNILFLTNADGLEAMRRKAIELGYQAEIADPKIQGEAREVGVQITSQEMAPKSCKIYGGEVTVTVLGEPCAGGRAQEMALAVLPKIPADTLLIAASSDGSDNGPAAGAMADREFYQKSQEAVLSIEDNLAHNCSYDFFQQIGGHIMTGKTGANVSDFYIVIKN